MKRRAEEDRHVEVLHGLLRMARDEAQARRQRGFERQRARRELEARVRRDVVRYCLRLRRDGLSHTEIARRLELRRTTLAAWRQRWHKNQLQSRPRGRPVQRLDTKTLHELQAKLEVHGPSVGVATLRQMFPRVPRRELREQLRQYRKKYQRENRHTVHALRWTRPGAVWAMDFSQPDQPLAGPFTQVLLVRDLASNKDLLWQPLRRATGWSVFMALRGLFARYGAPLVLKIDNAKAFDVPRLQGLIEGLGIVYLKSPPYAPWYNGAVEAGIGTVKAFVSEAAARADHPEYWTCDDLEVGRRHANHAARPFGLDGPNANEAWDRRAPISADERQRFRRQVLDRWASIVTANQNEQGGTLSKPELARAVRDAIQWALIEEGHLEIRRRRISPDIKRRKVS